MSEVTSEVSKPTVTVLGTGIMGAAMARTLLRHGLPVRVWNRARAKAQALAEHGAHVADSPAEAVTDADAVITMLSDGDAVREAMDAAVPGLRQGQVWAQMSTVGVTATEALARFARHHGLVFVDAPVLGTRQPAERGELVVFAAGPVDARARLEPVFDAVGQRTIWLADSGDTGMASRLKLVVNSWVLALTSGVAEALALARGLGLDPRLFPEIVAGGPLDSPYLQAKAAAILTGDYTPNFAVRSGEKDARLILQAAESAGVRLDLAAACRERFRRAVEQGHGEEDIAATYFASFDE